MCVFRERGAARIQLSSSNVASIQRLHDTNLIGAFTNVNNIQHFYSESPVPQVYGGLLGSPNFDVRLYDGDGLSIKREDIQHLAICFVLLDKMENKKTMMSLSGDLEKVGDKYTCTIDLPNPLILNPTSLVGVQDVTLPPLKTLVDGKLKTIIRDEGGAIVQCVIKSDIVSCENVLGQRLLRSFCLPVGERLYTSPYLILTQAAAGFYNNIHFNLSLKTCEDFQECEFRGKIHFSIVISQ